MQSSQKRPPPPAPSVSSPAEHPDAWPHPPTLLLPHAPCSGRAWSLTLGPFAHWPPPRALALSQTTLVSCRLHALAPPGLTVPSIVCLQHIMVLRTQDMCHGTASGAHMPMAGQPFLSGGGENGLLGSLKSHPFTVLKGTQSNSAHVSVSTGLVQPLCGNKIEMDLSWNLSPPGAHSLATETDEQIVPSSCGSAIIEVSSEGLCWRGTGSN